MAGRSGPRERLAAEGSGSLSDEELLAVLLGTGCSGRSLTEIASELSALLAKNRGAVRLEELRRIKGVGPSRACAIAAALELGRRREDPRPALDSPKRVFDELRFLHGERREHFVAFYLNACHRPLGRETVSIGTLTASLVHPREVFSPAIERAAAAVLVAHNHPSGDPNPSREDRLTTRRLVGAGKLLGIPLLDHVVVAEHRYFSFREQGLI